MFTEDLLVKRQSKLEELSTKRPDYHLRFYQEPQQKQSLEKMIKTKPEIEPNHEELRVEDSIVEDKEILLSSFASESEKDSREEFAPSQG